MCAGNRLSSVRVIVHQYYVTSRGPGARGWGEGWGGGRGLGRRPRGARRLARCSPPRSHARAPAAPPARLAMCYQWRSTRLMEYQHPQPVQPLGPPAPPPQLLPPAPPPPLPSLPQLQHGHVQDDDRWSQYHIWRQHVFVNGQFRGTVAGTARTFSPQGSAEKRKCATVARDRIFSTHRNFFVSVFRLSLRTFSSSYPSSLFIWVVMTLRLPSYSNVSFQYEYCNIWNSCDIWTQFVTFFRFFQTCARRKE